ncbi:MAG TPA: hypothetical protein VNV85_16860 [Puia sp.]|jgi:hypothetical protein|nr:hypothetical protein [Puia sp.]
MKKIFLAAGLSLATVTVTFAQGNNDSDNPDVSSFTKSQFATDFPDATNVHFANEKNFSEVSFTQEKEKISAYYDDRNQLVGTIQKKAFDDLPENAKKNIQKNYAGYTILDVVKFNDNESDGTELIQYGTSLDDGDNYFVELKKDSKAIVVKVSLTGGVEFWTTMK